MKERGIPKPVDRRDRMLRERVHDPYKARLKLKEPTVCTQCGAVYHQGRWRWGDHPSDAHEVLCQACHRTNDKYPAGEVHIAGRFFDQHRTEIMNLARNTEKVENEEHPLHRIMDIRDEEGGALINTTDIHLPRRIGQSLFDAYEGELDFHYDEGGYFIRVNWSRD